MPDLTANRMEVEDAAQDLRRRTLAKIERPLDRFIYLASTRDYNTGIYYHDGLVDRFDEEIARQALAKCHRQAFRELLGSPLKGLVSQLEGYMARTHTGAAEFITLWKCLEPYRVAVPVGEDKLSTELLFSNLKVALAILEQNLTRRSTGQRAA
jgi:hypothetical protein